MKKNLFLMTALFAGTMIISNDVCAGNIRLNQNDDQGTRKRTNAQMMKSNEPQEEGEIKRTHEQIWLNPQEQVNAAWGDAEKKEMAEKCITEISKYYEIDDYKKPLVFKTFNAINDREKATTILNNLIDIYKSDGYKEGGLSDYDREYMFAIIFGTTYRFEFRYAAYFKHDLKFMTGKSIPAAIKIAVSQDYKNQMKDFTRLRIIPYYVLGSADETELNFRKKVAQEYIKLVKSVNNETNIIAHYIVGDIAKSFFDSTNEQDLERRKQEIIKRYHIN